MLSKKYLSENWFELFFLVSEFTNKLKDKIDAQQSNTNTKKYSKRQKSRNIAAFRIAYDISCFLLIVNVILFIAYNNMEALDIPQESLLATAIRYGLYVGALFQMICLGAVIFMTPKNSNSTTAGTIWSFLKVIQHLSNDFIE